MEKEEQDEGETDDGVDVEVDDVEQVAVEAMVEEVGVKDITSDYIQEGVEEREGARQGDRLDGTELDNESQILLQRLKVILGN